MCTRKCVYCHSTWLRLEGLGWNLPYNIYLAKNRLDCWQNPWRASSWKIITYFRFLCTLLIFIFVTVGQLSPTFLKVGQQQTNWKSAFRATTPKQPSPLGILSNRVVTNNLRVYKHLRVDTVGVFRRDTLFNGWLWLLSDRWVQKAGVDFWNVASPERERLRYCVLIYFDYGCSSAYKFN